MATEIRFISDTAFLCLWNMVKCAPSHPGSYCTFNVFLVLYVFKGVFKTFGPGIDLSPFQSHGTIL